MATALPMPELAPVTRAFCPFNNLMVEQAGMVGSGNVSWTNLASKVGSMVGWVGRQRRQTTQEAQAAEFISQKRKIFVVPSAARNLRLKLRQAERAGRSTAPLNLIGKRPASSGCLFHDAWLFVAYFVLKNLARENE